MNADPSPAKVEIKLSDRHSKSNKKRKSIAALSEAEKLEITNALLHHNDSEGNSIQRIHASFQQSFSSSRSVLGATTTGGAAASLQSQIDESIRQVLLREVAQGGSAEDEADLTRRCIEDIHAALRLSPSTLPSKHLHRDASSASSSSAPALQLKLSESEANALVNQMVLAVRQELEKAIRFTSTADTSDTT